MAATDEPSDQASFPSYSEMIMAAIDALNDGNGASESLISKFIEETYGGLPSTHSVDLAVELARMKDSGELVLGENYYKRPDAGVAPKRGRGRPPKGEDLRDDGEAVATPTVAASIVPRPRGRPPKPKDPLAAAVAKAAHGLPKRRGRPPKNPRAPAAVAPVAPAAVVGVKRGRGRPPKVKPQLGDVGFG
ncbi:LOW QUALITY PROTEIN: HMG-Y-related protein A-like [Dioscorea cayenensis subsp. rotundata]|uniref:LOW QUALITY PROTEIN: HMG-Y-related protein A-like n=1 Tax=Dioscorea cayennensis subsp. rotundata TaxID=55577 RepID=A0AB40BIC6_DIOCR|nr:LOW QUALITY PROTEIN: HMG-Y-related protein A-like [Dioscorea cayenensis subsp. rotundata]